MTPWMNRLSLQTRKLFTAPRISFKGSKPTKLEVNIDGLDQADKQAIISLLRECGSSKALSDGKRVHSHIIKSGYDRDTFIGNLLVQMYGNCGCLENARVVFDGLRERNVFSWNLIMVASAQNGQLVEARNMFDRMPKRKRNVYSWNIIVTAYTQKGHLEEARSLFDEMPKRDVVSWNAMISAYARSGRGQEALHLFKRMEVQPDKITFISSLDACSSSLALGEGKDIHAKIISSGFQSDVVVVTALVNMYGKCGRPRDAKKAFDAISDCDLVLQTSMLTAYAENGHLREARSLFERMPKKDVVSWTSMVVACALNGDLKEAKYLFDRMPDRSAISWNAMIAAYVQNGEYRQAIQLFRLMDLEGMTIDKVTFISILDACANLTALEQGRIVHCNILDTESLPDVVIETALVNMYGKCGKLVEAKHIFDSMTQRTTASWNAMLSSYAQKGHGKKVFELYRLLNLEGELPDLVTFISLLSTCSHAGLVEDGWGYLVSMISDYGNIPAMDHYICTLDLLGRAGRLDDAEDLIDNMPFEPNVVAWTAVLGGCEIHGDVQRGKRVSKRFLDMGEESVAPYLLLSNMYAAAGNHDELAKLRELMRERGIKQQPGNLFMLEPNVD